MTIDPDFLRTGTFRSVSNQGGVFNGLMTGRDSSGAVWRAVADFGYENLLNQSPTQYRVGNARFEFVASGSTPSYAPDIRAYEATGSTLASVTFAGAVGDGTPDGTFVGGVNNNLTWWNGTSMMTPWFANNTADKMVGITADESAGAALRTYSNILLILWLIRPAPPTSLTTPANNSIISTLTPNLQAVAVTHPDFGYGEQTAYYFEITTGNSPGSGALVSSGWTAQTSWMPPIGSLVDGVTYHAWVYTNRLVPFQPAPHATHGTGYVPPIEPPVSRQFKIDLRLGAGGPSPMDQVGTVGGVSSTPSEGLPSTGTPGSAMNVNLVTGNLSVGVSSHAAGSLGGAMAVGMTYNSQAAVGAGLTGEYFADNDPAGEITEVDPMLLKRLDHTIDFAWQNGSPGPGVPADNFAVRWTGQIVAPAGTWKFVAGYQNNLKVWIDGNPLQLTGYPYTSGTDVTFAAGVPHDIRVEASYGTGVAPNTRLSMYNAAVAECNSSPCTASAGWLSPETSFAPDGWTVAAGVAGVSYVSVTDLGDTVAAVAGDGSSREFRRISPGVYAPPAGSQDLLTVDGTGLVTIQSSSGTTSAFRADGQLASITTAIDDNVSQPATHQYGYDTYGRLTTLRDPVTNRDLTLLYGGSGICPAAGIYPAAPDGKLCEIRTWDNRVTQLIYDPWSRVQRVVAPGSRVIDIGYDEYNRIVEWRDPLAADAYGNYTVGSQTLHKVVYESAGRVSSIQGPAPRPNEARAKSTYTYDPANRRTRVTAEGFTPSAGGGYARQVRYDTRLRIIESTDSAGLATTVEWDSQDRVIATTAPGGFRSTTRYNAAGLPTDAWGPAPASNWNIGVDPVTPSTPAAVPHVVTRYDENIDGLAAKYWPNPYQAGKPTRHGTGINPTSHEMARSWGTASPAPGTVNGDWSMRLTGEITLAAAGTHTFRLSTQGPATVWIDDTKILETATDLTTGFTTPVTAPFNNPTAGSTHRIRIDYRDTEGEAGIRVTYQEPGQSTFAYIPDTILEPGYGLATTVIDADGKTTATEYTDPANGIGAELGLATATIADPAGLALRTPHTYEAPSATTYLRQTARTLPAGNTWTSEYYTGTAAPIANVCGATASTPQAGMLKQTTGPDPDGAGPGLARVQQFVYDNIARQVGTRTGTTTTIGAVGWSCTAYDARGRVTQQTWPPRGGAPARTVTTTYAWYGGLDMRVVDGASTIYASFDILSRVRTYQADPTNQTTTSYDQIGRITTTTNTAYGTKTNTYEPSTGRLDTITLGATTLADITYDTIGRVSQVGYANGTTTTNTYDTLSRPSEVTHTGPGAVRIAGDKITKRSLNGRVLDHHVDTGAANLVDANPAGDNYLYDGAGRVTTAHTVGVTATYGYANTTGCALNTAGANTNRTTVTYSTGGGGGSYCYDNADRLTAAPGTTTVTYDDRGNTTSYGTQTLTWDAAGRHATTTNAGTTITYTYDAVDRITRRTVTGTSPQDHYYRYAGHGDTATALVDTAGNVIETYHPLPGGVLYTKRTSGDTWSHPNLQGHVIALTNATGVRQGTPTTYDIYGRQPATPDNTSTQARLRLARHRPETHRTPPRHPTPHRTRRPPLPPRTRTLPRRRPNRGRLRQRLHLRPRRPHQQLGLVRACRLQQPGRNEQLRHNEYRSRRRWRRALGIPAGRALGRRRYS